MVTSDNCWSSPAFLIFWDKVHEFTDGMIFDEGWALDTLIYHFNEGTLEEDAADDVLNEASIPEDGLLPWSGSIPWHDGI